MVTGRAASASAEEPVPRWTRVAERTEWTPRDSCGEAVFRDRLWLLGGWLDSYSEPPRDVWSSADGRHWQRAVERAPWRHSDLPTTVVFDDQLWIFGGWHNGRLSDASASREVWSTRDGQSWQCQTDQAPWDARLGAAGVVFQNQIWLLGGVRRYYDGGPADLLSDVWKSSDGRHWQRVTPQAPWAPRAYHAAVVHQGKLYVLGGGNYQPEYQAHGDVWSTADGEHWTRLTPQAPWPPRIWFSGVAFRDRLWVLGGWSNHPFANHNDVWHSADGAHWQRLETETCWTPRHEHSAFVFQDALWVTAGHAAPLANDVWRLDLPPDWPDNGPAAAP